MLAKVLKSDTAQSFAAFSLPEIGAGNHTAKNFNSFVVPDLSDFKVIEETSALEIAIEPENVAPKIEELLQEARDEAARIVAQAEANSEAIAEAAREKAIGEVEAQFEAKVAECVAEVRTQLTQTIEEVSNLADSIINRAEPQLVELAVQIAKKIVHREVTIDREIALTLVKVSLSKLHSRAVAEIHLNPEDFNYVETHREKLDFRGSLELVEDKSVSVGGCLIHTETGDIDARIESQFDEIAHGLLG